MALHGVNISHYYGEYGRLYTLYNVYQFIEDVNYITIQNYETGHHGHRPGLYIAYENELFQNRRAPTVESI